MKTIISTALAVVFLLSGQCGFTVETNNVAGADKTKAQKEDLEWSRQTLIVPYDKIGRRDAKWDAFARSALQDYAELFSLRGTDVRNLMSSIATNCAKAVAAGCDDPLIIYMHARYTVGTESATETAYADALRKAAKGMGPSQYPAIRKFYASLRAAEQLKFVAGTNTPLEVDQFRFLAVSNLTVALADKTMPIQEVYDACQGLFNAVGGNPQANEYTYKHLEKPLFQNWPDESASYLLKGEFYISSAWQARGSGYASTVTDQGWKLFGERLSAAEEALDRAWKLNPKDPHIAKQMISVELGQGKGRERMELWFGRAMALDTNYYDACNAKLYYLEPKWHGSEDDLLAFGWECAQSKAWGGNIPLILVDAHAKVASYLKGEDKTNYWKQPDVWFDCRTAYERFFQLNPDAVGWYHNYARCAYQCEAWDKLNELIPKLGTVNYSFFGGNAEFDKMVQLAKKHANEKKPARLSVSGGLSHLIWQVSTKLHHELKAEADFADELHGFDALLAEHKGEKTDEIAQILYEKAALYLEVLDNADKGTALIKQLKSDFPDTETGRNADKILAATTKKKDAKKIQDSLAEGKMFPDFNEKDVNGKTVSVASYKGKVLLVDFWATWCPPCVAELPGVLQTYQKHHAQGFEIIGISLDKDEKALTDFIKEKNMTWQQFFDGQYWQNKLAVKYGIESIPATFLLDGDGKIIGKDLSGEALEQAVSQALAKK